MKKLIYVCIIISIFVTLILMGFNYFYHGDIIFFLRPSINFEIKVIATDSDLDNDGINDYEDIIEGARKEIENKTKYKSAYYAGGYPPEDEGVCTDVVWRALKNAGYNLKKSIDEDIESNTDDYYRIEIPDPNIDFRRVDNQYVFFEKFMISFTTKIIPYDKENLEQWQGGDIVVLSNSNHVAIISNKRRKDGVPYIIHNSSTYPKEEDKLYRWFKYGRIIGHYRFTVTEY